MCSSNAYGNPYGGLAQAGASQSAAQRSKTPTVTMFNKAQYKKALEGYTESAIDKGNTWAMYAEANNRTARLPGENWQQHNDRMLAEQSAFESSAAYRRAETGAEWGTRQGREQSDYVARYIAANENLDPATGLAWTDHGYGTPPPASASSGGSSGGGATMGAPATPGAPGAPAAPAGPRDVMAAKNKQKKAQKAGQSARGRTALRI